VPRLFMFTVPGLKVASDWLTVHDRLLDAFPEVIDVLATTMPETLLIVYQGELNIDDWLEGVSAGILGCRALAGRSAYRTAASQPPTWARVSPVARSSPKRREQHE
jgi:hypothetical protein